MRRINNFAQNFGGKYFNSFHTKQQQGSQFMKRLLTILMTITAIGMLTVALPVMAQDACEGQIGAAYGLCTAASHLGCGTESEKNTDACVQIENSFLKNTGEIPPWLAPTTCNVAGRSCRIFRTATEWPYDAFGGLAGADAKCQASADAASLGGTFMAWLSTSTTSAADRLVHAGVPYTRVDGTLIASDWADLTDGALSASILTTESGLPVPIVFPEYGRAWTGTNETGVTQTGCAGGGFGCTCNDWQTTLDKVYTNPGLPDFSNFSWTGPNGGGMWCQKLDASGGLGLYCVEQ